MASRAKRLTHLDAANRPTMVDVGSKEITRREAVAEALVKLPANVARELLRSGHRTKKGPVFDTAIIAGVLAAKRTHELIPFCHPLPLSSVKISVATRRGGLRILCEVGVEHRTGVEMEALAGASLIVNPSASPYHRGKGIAREEMIRRRARETGAGIEVPL